MSKLQYSKSKAQTNQHKLNITGPHGLAKEEKNKKLQLIKRKLQEDEKFLLIDFNMDCEFTYECNPPQTLNRKLFVQESTFELGKSSNFLFYCENTEVIRKINFDISEVFDSRGNNILHYAVFRHNLDLVNSIFTRAKSDNIIEKLINHRNLDGTTPLGMTFLFENENNLVGIEIASIFVSTYEYHINSYLNNKTCMDYSKVELIGGTNLLHNVILTASKCTDEKIKQSLSTFFKFLTKRMADDQINESSYLNPNYPTMNPGLLAPALDGHMISTSHLLDKLKFNSKKIEQLCKKYFDVILQLYEANQFDDSSGDSEDEYSHAYTYREMLLEFDEFIKTSLDGHLTKDVNNNFQRTFDKYNNNYSIVPTVLWKQISTEGNFDQIKCAAFWKSINSSTNVVNKEVLEQFYIQNKDALNSIVVPLFHGVPFMHSQYTNYQRREVVKKIFELNRKLLGKFDGSMTEEEYTLTSEEKILIGIHSRTSTATAGMQSLYEIMIASDEDLRKLEEVDNELLEYFKRNSPLPSKFKTAMKDYIFNFSSSPIREFWENNNDGVLPNDSIVKYRFPVIATSKAPDHPIRFAIGRNVEGTMRGETPMQPEYVDGHPTHRVAGFVYITLHKLSDLISESINHTMIDVNQGLSSGEISNGRGAERFKNQLECDFLGKMDSDRIIAVVPIVYPNMQEEAGFKPTYHQAIYGISPNSKGNSVVSPEKIKKGTDENPNPDIMSSSGNIAGFGKMILPSVVSMVNGIVVAVAQLKNWFLCTIKDDNELVPYQVGFDQVSGQFSKVQQILKPTSSTLVIDRLWKNIMQNQSQQDEQLVEILVSQTADLSINHESKVIGNSAEMETLISQTATLSIQHEI